MSVYVDPLMACVPNPRWKWDSACHMFADSLAELHDFAARIGLLHTWFQRSSRIPHYDLTPGKRREAVAAGAVELDRRQTINFWHAKGWCGWRKKPSAASACSALNASSPEGGQ
jgi:hypothetical protein